MSPYAVNQNKTTRVYCATWYGESNSFSPLHTSYEDFSAMDLAQRGSKSFSQAFEPVFAAGGLVLGNFNKAALPGGLVTREAYATLRQELLADLEVHLPVDLIVLNLHGAVVAEDTEDTEGDILARIRRRVGSAVPIVASLDPHAHLSRAMLDNADLLRAYKEYPHIDEAEVFADTVRLGLRILNKEARPIQCVADCHVIGIYHTFRDPMRGLVASMRDLESQPGILSVSLIHGFPWGDVGELGTKVLVVSDNDRALGEKVAENLAQRVCAAWPTSFELPTPFRTAIDEAQTLPGPVVIADVADNPGGGAAGDSTFLLSYLLERHAEALFGPLWDPVAVGLAARAGVGARLQMRIGGKLSAASGIPVDGNVQVLAHLRELRTPGVGGYEVSYGEAVAIKIGGVSIVLTSLREQAMSPAMFTLLGLDPAAAPIVIVKSSQHFRAGYDSLARKVILADSPGALTLDFAAIRYQKAPKTLRIPSLIAALD